MAAIETAGEQLERETRWTNLAQEHWIGPDTIPKARTEVIEKDVWDELERSGFSYRSLLKLESLQALERYLWPGYHEDSSDHHVLLIAFLITTKTREKLPAWSTFLDDSSKFPSLFRRILSMGIDVSLPTTIRTQILCFLISAFQSLDNGLVRKECAALVSISVWHNLGSQASREAEFEKHHQLRKVWRASQKRFDNADTEGQSRLRFERAWLYTMIVDFLGRLNHPNHDDTIYCERFIEFITDLISQLPTRRYVNTLLKDMNLLALLRTCKLYDLEDHALFRDLFMLFCHFMDFPIEDHSGLQLSRSQTYERHCNRLAILQRTALKAHKDKLALLALSHYALVGQRNELDGFLEPLTDQELQEFCKLLGLRIDYPTTSRIPQNRNLHTEILISAFEQRPNFQERVRNLSVMPTEVTLYEESLLRNETYDGSRSLAIPKLNLQYLSVGDFLWRAYILYRCESFFEVRKDMEETMERLAPKDGALGRGIHFEGFSKMAIPITRPAIIEVAPPHVGFDQPAFVRAEITLDTARLADRVRREWSTLRQGDTVYLVAASSQQTSANAVNGNGTNGRSHKLSGEGSGIKTLRTAEIVQLQDVSGSIMRENQVEYFDDNPRRQRLGRLIVNIDPAAYKLDYERKESGKPDVYESINVIIRRKGRENNFSKILQTMRMLNLTDMPSPSWLRDVFLGFGDPSGATYSRLPNRLRTLDFRDTFLDLEHLKESLPQKKLEPHDQISNGQLSPPFVLETINHVAASDDTKLAKKRKRDETQPAIAATETIKVQAYKPPNLGPYPHDAPKLNSVRFTPAQVEGITSGTQPGLTLIIGPPGTGKTDVATQIINNIYHDFPAQRTVVIAHSNQALNQLFQKITNLEIDQRHLLRLGHGEDSLATDVSYGKYGRVESFMDNRTFFLSEVDRLAVNLNAPGAHGNSCETAGYFDTVYIGPAWSKFWAVANDADTSSSEIVSAFPFHQYFANAPQPLFPSDASKEAVLDIATGCQRHVSKIFSELADIRPFEILRHAKDKTNYLMLREARIIAMTSTHAAMHRQQYADLGFKYDNVVIEEAAQITEIETFIPFVLQKPKPGDNPDMPLQRAILLGDHLQNSPIVQNAAFRQFANLEQSLFQRFVRLGVPTINLDAQGRARPSLANLYAWRYQKLTHLPHVLTTPEFLLANPGFRHEFQFIHVPDYQSQGETQPSPHFFQNLGEAEYAVAIYQYMRLLGYPANSISILATYAGQRSLIRDILLHRCSKNRLFGMPRIVATVDKYQGEQNDYVILSLTRTHRPGFLRSIRRMTVAFSRARLGLYVLGRREILEQCPELGEFVRRLCPEGRYPEGVTSAATDGESDVQQNRDTLSIVTNELFGPHLGNPASARKVDDEVEAVQMVSVEHLGQYVYEMTKAKVDALRREAGGGKASSNSTGAAAVQIQDGTAMDVEQEKGDESIIGAKGDAGGEDEEREEEEMGGTE